MRTILVVLVLCSAVCADLIIPTQRVDSGLYVRSEPQSGPNVITNVYPGQAAQFLADTTRYWQVRTQDGKEGYVSKAYSQRITKENEWALKIRVFDVGQAGAAALITDSGQAVLFDLGRWDSHGQAIYDYLDHHQDSPEVSYIFASHYDADHIGGAKKLDELDLSVAFVYDQGPSLKREEAISRPTSVYKQYLDFVGDPNGNGIKDAGENDFIRQPAEAMLDTVFVLGATDKIEIWTLSVNGNTNRSQHDLNLNLANTERDENPGSIISLVRYGDFEYLTTGDATTDDWKVKPDTEEAVIDADAIPGGNDIDVLIVAHHGSDTSSGKVFIEETAPEVAIISSTLTRDHIPKKPTLRVLREYNALVLVTGNAHNEAGNYHESGHAYDNGWSPSSGVLDNQGWIEISVHPGGESYMVEAEKGATRYYSSIDHTP